MGIILIFLGCFLLYAKSKHVPRYFSRIEAWAKQQPKKTRLLAYGLFALSVVIFCWQNGIATGLVAFLVALMFGLCLTIIFLPLHKKYAYLLVGLSLVLIIINTIL
ncbi:DUF3325 family protein [Ulvibacterium sp.]|uniref:DUF3325 family protein n=1 Tax=Ulvibacterium sp. TaxID=2665914 RepID=UPI00345D00EB